MAHPGMAFAFVFGVGLAALLYYIFTDDNSHNNHHQNGSNGHRNSSSDNPNSWSESNRRNVISDCTICLMELSSHNIAHISPCQHSFHKKCIQNWQMQRDLDGHKYCPNCRTKIQFIH